MSYVDLTTEFESGDLITWQQFQQLADNDAFKHLPSATVMLFIQATAPTGWTKQTGFSSQALRVVDGSGGSTGGGSVKPGDTISLAHTHSISTGHVHAVGTHTHDQDTLLSGVGLNPPIGTRIVSADTDDVNVYLETSGSTTVRKLLPYTKTNPSQNSQSANSGAVASSLADIVFKYQDSIIAVKD